MKTTTLVYATASVAGRVLAGAGAVALVVATGAPLTARGYDLRWNSGATWLRAGAKFDGFTARSPHWYAWPGWQRSLSRVAGAGLLGCAVVWPQWTAAGVALGVITVMILVVRAIKPEPVGPRRVTSIAGRVERSP